MAKAIKNRELEGFSIQQMLTAILISGLLVGSPPQLLHLGGELVLVHASVLDGQLHVVQLLVRLLRLELQLQLLGVQVLAALVQALDLHVVLVHSDLKLLNDLFGLKII